MRDNKQFENQFCRERRIVVGEQRLAPPIDAIGVVCATCGAEKVDEAIEQIVERVNSDDLKFERLAYR